ncbi:hypothetical protein Ait01nite_076920 [Actinoplanes italicus]|uniref:NACHT domain-containing protein n=1 Tax=Actinoplanes italicus TaxID=113567 RepID=A0A2T0JZ24_9ACTN|nr:hypothetical protein [Actinoplanes italicus]PRX14782.1 hypothetical protein CLV67_123168 [Actinoplanes italicus]GIE34647.1 hypothetical protein Ait01nite_076920 [Actinoplanes italicus]
MPNQWSRPRVWFLITLVVAAATALILAWFLRGEGLERADKWASVVFGSVSALVACTCLLTWLWRLGSAGTDREAVLAGLAATQREQWTAEQAARRVGEPWPLNVRWAVNAGTEAVMARWASVRGSAGAGPVEVDGDYAGIATVLDRPDLPKRLVILGEPGAGKSVLAMRLTLQLLDCRGAGDPVAVLLDVAGWNPVQPLDDWIADQLIARDRRFAGTVPGPAGESRSLARDLVAGGCLLPVLDGLDELDDELQRAALIGLSGAATAGRDFVVTCRTRPYRAAVAACGPIPAAVVVELQPVPPEEAAQHLDDSAAAADRRWSPVLAELRGQPSTPLTEALSTPLMIWLARTVYRNPDRNPEELLTADWADSREGIERHLMDHLIPAAYATAGGVPAAEASLDGTRLWLSTLAAQLREQRIHDLAWWRIHEIRPAPAAQVASVVYAITVALFLPFAGGALGLQTVPVDAPVWLSLAIGGAVLGVLLAFGRILFTDRHHPRRVSARGLVRSFIAVVVPILVAGPFFAGDLMEVVAVALSAGVVSALVGGGEPAPSAAAPRASLAMDRTVALTSAATAGTVEYVLLALGYGPLAPWAWIGALMMTLAAVLLSAWGQFHLATLVLAARGQVPLRLARHLDDAHRRGVLRCAGSVYQFRHALLRDRLAAVHERTPV